MLSRSAAASVVFVVAIVPAAADEVTTNRGVACSDRAEAAALHALTERKDHAGWAKASGALMAAGQCVLLLQGAPVKLKSPPADWLAEIEAKGHAAALWVEAASVSVAVPSVLPDVMGERLAMPGEVYECAELQNIEEVLHAARINSVAYHRARRSRHRNLTVSISNGTGRCWKILRKSYSNPF